MAERPDQLSMGRRILSWLPFALPVLGGLVGMIVVNMNRAAFLNPIVAVALGVVAGRVLAGLILRAVPEER